MSKVSTGKTPTPLKQTNFLKRPASSATTSPTRLQKPNLKSLTLKTKPKIDHLDSKSPTVDKSIRTADTSPWQTSQKIPQNLISDSFLCGKLVLEDNSLDFSSLGLYGNNNHKDILHDLNKRETQDEVGALRKELKEKNEIIDHLKKENLGLRKEVEEFISIADKIHANLDQELKQYASKISTLEQENSELLAENRFYKEQTHRRFRERSHRDQIPVIDNVVSVDVSHSNDSYSTPNKKCLEKLYSSVNDQLMTFVEASKEQLHEFIKGVKIDTPKLTEKSLSSAKKPREEDKTPKKPLYVKKELSRLSSSPSPSPTPLMRKVKSTMHSRSGSTTFSSSIYKDLGIKRTSEVSTERKLTGHSQCKNTKT